MRKGDKVYCINNVSLYRDSITLNPIRFDFDTIYIVRFSFIQTIILDGFDTHVNKKEFITENNYLLSKRLEKISKIKNNIHE